MRLETEASGLDIFLGTIETRILEYFWKYKTGSISDLSHYMEYIGLPRHFNTIMTITQRMVGKSYLGRIKRQNSYEYYALCSRRRFLKKLTKELNLLTQKWKIYLKTNN